jgi:hypothetical protein
MGWHLGSARAECRNRVQRSNQLPFSDCDRPDDQAVRLAKKTPTKKESPKMNDLNEARFSGAVMKSKIIERPIGLLIRFYMVCGGDKISVVFRTHDRAHAERLAQCPRLWVTGQIRSDSWDGLGGVRRYGWKIVADEVKPLDEEPGATNEESEND